MLFRPLMLFRLFRADQAFDVVGIDCELLRDQGDRVGLAYLTDWTPDSKALVGEDHTESGKVRISMGLINSKNQAVPVLETTGANLYASRLT